MEQKETQKKEVIKCCICNKDINDLDHGRCRRNSKQQNSGQAIWKHHPEYPGTGFAVSGMGTIHQMTNQNIRNAVEKAGNQHNGTDGPHTDTDNIGIKIKQQ